MTKAPPGPVRWTPDLVTHKVRRIRALQQLHQLKRIRDATEAASHVDRAYVNDPVGWATDRLGIHLWSKQRETLEAVRDHPRVAVRSAHSTGKSFNAATAVAWWLSVHEPGTAFAVTTAPTNPQVRAILWREINRLHRTHGLVGRTNQTEWLIGEELVGYGRKSADTDPDAFQGIHAEHLLIVIDEANGVSPALWEAADTLAAGGNARILVIGNPDSPGSHFAKVCKPGSGWHRIRISAFDTPNYTGESVPDILNRLLTQPAWVERKRREWGTDHPFWFSKVLAEFPETDEALVINLRDVTAAQALWDDIASGKEPDDPAPRILSVDVARMGTDQTVFGLLEGRRFQVVETTSKQRTTQTTGRAIRHARHHNVGQIRVDSIGVGAGVADELHGWLAPGNPDRLRDCRLVEMEAGAQPTRPDEFVNARAEWWFAARDAMRDGELAIDPDDEDLAAQLLAPRYDVVSGHGRNAGKLKVESKDDMRARGVSSPDRADALVMAVAPTPPEPAPPVTNPPTDPDVGPPESALPGADGDLWSPGTPSDDPVW